MKKLTLLLLLCLGTERAVAQTELTRPDLATFKSSVSGLIKKYCVECHGNDEQKGDVRLDTIDADIVNGKSVSLWKDVLHRIETGEMPPEGEPQPTDDERDSLATWIRAELRKNITAQLGVPGRVVVRRLSRTEYRNTMRDLLGLNYDVGRDLPPDTTYHGFDHVASVQELSRSQMETYLRLARFAIDKAIVTGHRPMSFSYRAEPELGKAGLQWRVNSHVPENEEAAKAFAASYRIGRGEQKMEADQWSSTYRFDIRTAQGKFGSSKEYTTKTGIWLKAPRRAYEAKGADWGRIGLRLPHVPRDDGLYRLRIKSGAKRKEGLGTPLLSVWVFKKLLGDFEITASADDPQWYEFVFAEQDLKSVQIHSDDNRFSKTPVTDIVLNNGYENPGRKMGHRGWTVPEEVDSPGVFVDAIEFETNYSANWPPRHHREILFDSPLSDEPEQYATEVLTRFMSRAFRRPVRDDELAGKLDLFRQAYAEDSDFVTAINEPLVATLVSPQFLFLTEDHGVNDSGRRKLNDYELASRLSYFLWSTMPDDQLMSLAADGTLTKPDVLQRQIDRMLNDDRATELHRGFMSQWLGLRKLDDIMIDDDRWIIRTGLRTSMKTEPAKFFGEMLRGNLSLMNFIDSDFAVLNERLAQHYGIPGVYGNEFRKVSLTDEHTRGGLLTQAASMTITTDGMITSPIYRGKWVLEKLLDMPPPPAPANVPPLDDAPEERLSLRDQFARHRENASCAACHKKIDPLGWPFERYSILGEHSEYGWGPNWVQFHDPKRNKQDERPDLHGTLPDGTRVDGVRDLKRVLLENHQSDVLRSVTKSMLIYALGRPLDISDDVTVDQIVETVSQRNNGTRELVRAVIFSPPFLEK